MREIRASKLLAELYDELRIESKVPLRVRQFPNRPWITITEVQSTRPTIVVRTPQGVMSFDPNQELQIQD